MGAVLVMLLALVLPVAPAAAVDVQDDVQAAEALVQAAAVTQRALFNECASNPQNQNKTSYFFTLTSSTGTRIPFANGGAPATATLIGIGTANLNQTIPLTVGDLESRAQPGTDRGNGVLGGVPNGICTDLGPTPDTLPATNDGLINDYGTAQPVQTGSTAVGTFFWKLLITFPGHVSQVLDLTPLVDGALSGTVGPPAPNAPYGGNGCSQAGLVPPVAAEFLADDRGCIVSLGTIQLSALTVPQSGRGSISGTVTDISGLPLGSSQATTVAILTSVVTTVPGVADGAAQITTASSHGLVPCDTVQITGHSVPLFNSFFVVQPCPFGVPTGNIASTTTFNIVLAAGTLDLTKNPPAPPDLNSTGSGGALLRANSVTVATNVTAIVTTRSGLDQTGKLSVTTNAAHGLVAGDTVTIRWGSGAPAGFNLINTSVTNVDSATSFRALIPQDRVLAVNTIGTGGTVFKANAGGGVEIVLYRQPDQDPTNDAAQPIPENSAQSVLTDPGTGQYFVNNLWPGRYSVTLVDTRIQFCSLNANCGLQPITKVVNLFPTGVYLNTPDVLQQTANFAVPIDTAAAQAPGQTLTGGTTGLFGYIIDGSSGGRIGSLTPGQFGFNPNGGSGGLAAPVQLTFTPVQPVPCATGLNPPSASSGCIGTVTTATTDTNGRYQVVLVAGVQYTVAVTGFANAVNNITNIGLIPTGGLPLGFTGACSAGGNDSAITFPGALFPCGVGATGQDRFVLSATALAAGSWNGGGSFVLVPSNATQIPAIGQTTVRRLEAVIPGIYRNPDTSYTGVDVETIQVRIMNNGVQRTGAQIEWFSTSSDDVASLVKTDTLDLNPGAVGIFTRSIIPDGCTRCMAQIFSIDLDAPNPFLGPGYLPTNTPAVPGVNGFVYGLSDLQATVTHRVVEAGNAIAGGNGITFEDIFPTGNSVNSGFIIPLVYKNYGGGAHKWSSIVSGCLTRGVGGPQPINFDFLSNGESRGGPFQITRSTNPGGCIVLNLNTFDPNDPDYFDPLAGIPDGTYSVVITSTAGTLIPSPPEVPGGFFASALSYSITARMATLGNGNVPIGGENATNGIRELYAPLVFKRYNDWNSGIAIAGFRPRTPFLDFAGSGGGSGAGASIAVYGEDGTLMGVFLDQISRSSGARIHYLPTLPIQLPDGFRGSIIISVGDQTGGTRTGASVQTVNYERNQATSYNFITQDTSVRAPTPNARPCTYAVNSTTDPTSPQIGPPNTINPLTGLIQNPTNYVSCLTVPDAERRFGGAPRGSGATFEVGLGPTTGIRLFNPDPYKNGTSAYVSASYLDSSGIVYIAYTTFSIPAYHTATIFMGADTQLPDIYDGSMFVQATAPIVGIGQVVDYRITDRDASYAFNLPNQSGRTN